MNLHYPWREIASSRAEGFFLEMMTLFRLGLFFKFVRIFAQSEVIISRVIVNDALRKGK